MANRIGKAFSLRLAQCAKGKKMNLGGWQPRWVDFHSGKGQEAEFGSDAHSDTVPCIATERVGGASRCAIARGLLRDKAPNLRGGKAEKA